MIRAVIVMNTHGKPRFAKFYDFQPVGKQLELIRSIYGVFVETLDKCFKNVCELDLVFNYSKVRNSVEFYQLRIQNSFGLAGLSLLF